ncbi:MAG: hypothetical protein ACLSAP_07465 [Oscillospiraceae bacterium]
MESNREDSFIYGMVSIPHRSAAKLRGGSEIRMDDGLLGGFIETDDGRPAGGVNAFGRIWTAR